uniref:MFS transporter n=1 Tax=uncultured Pseudomonas sp. TaxID=114707 RepID=UPI0025F22950
AIFNSAQYFATVLFAPLMGWIVYHFGWQHVFVVMGALGIAFSAVWMAVIYSPREHPRANSAEVEYIASNGGLVDLDTPGKKSEGPKWSYIGQLLTNRMMAGIYLGQFCINALTYFFLTWFPVYLVQERGMTILKAGIIASLPAICGFIGGVLGGVISDWLLRRGSSLSVARKTPIVAGMLLSMSMILCMIEGCRLRSVPFSARARRSRRSWWRWIEGCRLRSAPFSARVRSFDCWCFSISEPRGRRALSSAWADWPMATVSRVAAKRAERVFMASTLSGGCGLIVPSPALA